MKLKRKRDKNPLIDPGDILIAYDLACDLPQEHLIAALVDVKRAGWAGNARELGMRLSARYLIVVNVQTEEAAAAVRENLSGHAHLRPASIPPVLSRLLPLGRVLPKTLGHLLVSRMAEDPLLIELYRESMAARMDQFPEETGFIFPDLSPEEYAVVKAKGKPS